MNKILTREQYLDTLRTQRYSKYTGIPKSNEAFSNDVNWGDSWVGKMINSIARKVKIKFNLKRIDSLSNRLKALFDEMLETSKIESPYGVQEIVTTSYLIGDLATAIEEEKDVTDLIGKVVTLEGQVTSYNLEDQDELLRILKEFREFLQGLEDEGGSEEGSEEGAEVEEVEQVGAGGGGSVGKVTYAQMILNLQDLKRVLDTLKYVSIEGEPSKTPVPSQVKVQPGKKYLLIEGPKKSKVLCVSNTNVMKIGPDKKWRTDDDVQKNKLQPNTSFVVFLDDSGNYNETSPTKVVDNKLLQVTNESYIFEDVATKTTASSVIKKAEVSAVSALQNFRKASAQLVDSKIKGIAVDGKFIDEILKDKNKKETIEAVKNLYKIIYSYLLGERKDTLNPYKTPLFKESVDILNDKSKLSIIAEKIARFSYTSLKFNDKDNPLTLNPKKTENLYSAMGDFGKSIEKYNKSLSDILNGMKGVVSEEGFKEKKTEYKVGDVVKYKLKDGGEGEKEITKIEGDKFFFMSKDGKELSSDISNITSKVEKKEEVKKESLLRYEGFRKINEAVNYDAIASKFNDLFTEDIQDKFQFTETQVQDIKDMGKTTDNIVLRNSDSIMEIVRLFQRAWRLHTVPTIPSGRTGGKVSMSVYLEYEYLGTGTPGEAENPGYGPWRNIELYEKWNDAVMGILSNTKYTTTIFSEDATFSWEYKDKKKDALISKSQIIGGVRDSYSFDTNQKLILEAEKDEKKQINKPLGKILLRFITRLLNDSSMYSSQRGEGGNNLQQFLNEYFSIDDNAIKKAGGLSFVGFNDVKKNRNTADDLPNQTSCGFFNWTQISDKQETTLRDYLREQDDMKGLIFKLNIDGKTKYFYYLLKDTSKTKVWFLVLDSWFFGTSNIKGTLPRMKKPGTVELLELNYNLSENKLQKDKSFKADVTQVFSESKPKESNKQFNLKDEVKVFLKIEDKTVFLDAKLEQILGLPGLKNNVRTASNNKINL